MFGLVDDSRSIHGMVGIEGGTLSGRLMTRACACASICSSDAGRRRWLLGAGGLLTLIYVAIATYGYGGRLHLSRAGPENKAQPTSTSVQTAIRVAGQMMSLDGAQEYVAEYFRPRKNVTTLFEPVFSVVSRQVCSKGDSPTVVIVCLTLYANTAQRNSIRETWASVVRSGSWPNTKTTFTNIKTDTFTDIKADTLADTKTDILTDIKADTFTDTKTDTLTDIKTDTFTDIQTDTFSDIKTDTFTDKKPDTFADTKTDTLTDTETDTLTDTKADTFADKKPDTFADTKTDTLTDKKPDTFTDTKTDTFSDIKTDTFSDIKTDTVTDIKTDTFTDIKTDTPAAGSPVRNTSLKLVFLTGDPAAGVSAEEREAVRDEMREHGDIVHVAMQDVYTNLSTKVLAALNWTHTFCPSAKFVMKIDEDTFLHVPNLLQYLKSLSVPPEGLVAGYVLTSPFVVRNKKNRWHVSQEIYPFPRYPLYTSGCTYVISGNAIARLLAAAKHMPFIGNEDAFITGVLRTAIGARLVHANGFTRRGESRAKPCQFLNDVRVAGTNTDSATKRAIWEEIRNNNSSSNCYRPGRLRVPDIPLYKWVLNARHHTNTAIISP